MNSTNFSGISLKRDSIKMSLFWNRTVFKSGLYSSQASIDDFTVIKEKARCNAFHSYLVLLTLTYSSSS